jgi:hypothetical protein
MVPPPPGAVLPPPLLLPVSGFKKPLPPPQTVKLRTMAQARMGARRRREEALRMSSNGQILSKHRADAGDIQRIKLNRLMRSQIEINPPKNIY